MLSAMLGTLLLAASLTAQAPADPRLEDGVFSWLDGVQTQQQVAQLFGPPKLSSPFGSDFLSWQYHFGADHHDASHTFVFRRSTGKLVSIARAYDGDQSVSHFFPRSASEQFHHKSSGQPPYPVLVRRLRGNRLLLAMGATQDRAQTNQLILIDRQALPAFHPWLVPLLE